MSRLPGRDVAALAPLLHQAPEHHGSLQTAVPEEACSAAGRSMADVEPVAVGRP